MNVLVTGAAGYIGSHAVKRLLAEGYGVIGVDSLRPGRGNAGAIEALQDWAGRTGAGGRFWFVRADVRDDGAMETVIREHAAEAAMHFAALAYVGESVSMPLEYHDVNGGGTLSTLRACVASGVGRFVFSSSCATYGEPPRERIPIAETCPQRPVNPYGWSKLHGERLLFDVAEDARRRGAPFACCALRYFNVAGADADGVVGEAHEPETHLIPSLLRAALGLRGPVTIFGDDYPTPDGSCVRDYVHVEDLVAAHVAALKALEPARHDVHAWNVGAGLGASVRQVAEACARAAGRDIPTVTGPRRAGDPPMLIADATRIATDLGWRARTTDLQAIAASAWSWLRSHPNGYG